MKKTLFLIASASILLLASCGGKKSSDADQNDAESAETFEEVEDVESNLPSGLYPVDLGLSVCWANYNLGAECEQGTGEYFAWGEIESKKNYSDSTYKWCDVVDNEIKPTKYTMDVVEDEKVIAKGDGLTVLQPEDDAASNYWSSDWRIPTADEMKELKQRCTWIYGIYEGVIGYQVTGPNGNSIFLPCAGYAKGEDVRNVGKNGYYWTSTLGDLSSWSKINKYALALRIQQEVKSTDMWKSTPGYYISTSSDRQDGFTIRPVFNN